MKVQIDRSTKSLDKRDRAWLSLLAVQTVFHRLIDVILTVAVNSLDEAIQ
jgi:hypothetical protein